MSEVDLVDAWRIIDQGWQWFRSNWLELLKALAAPIIAVAALRVSRQQVEINASKLRLDLYDRRSEVYTAVKTLLTNLFVNANIKQEELDRFRQQTVQVDFLFDDSISRYLASLSSKAQRLIVCKRLHQNGFKRRKGMKTPWQEVEELELWLYQQEPIAKELFTPFLRLEQPIPHSLKQRISLRIGRLVQKSLQLAQKIWQLMQKSWQLVQKSRR